MQQIHLSNPIWLWLLFRITSPVSATPRVCLTVFVNMMVFGRGGRRLCGHHAWGTDFCLAGPSENPSGPSAWGWRSQAGAEGSCWILLLAFKCWLDQRGPRISYCSGCQVKGNIEKGSNPHPSARPPPLKKVISSTRAIESLQILES